MYTHDFYSTSGKGYDFLSHKSSLESVMETPQHQTHRYNCKEVRRVQDCILSVVQTFTKQVLAGPVHVILALYWGNSTRKGSRISDQPTAHCLRKLQVSAPSDSPQAQLVFPTDIFVTFPFGDETGQGNTPAIFPSSSPHLHPSNPSKIKQSHDHSHLQLRRNQCQPARHSL